MAFSRITNYITKKAEQVKKAVFGEEENQAKKPAASSATTEPVKLVSDKALEQDANMGLGVERTTTPTQSKGKIAEQVKGSGAETPSSFQQSSITQASVKSSVQPQVEPAEKTTNSSKILELAADDPIWAQNAENNKKNKKPSFDKTLSAFYGKRYTEGSDEEKEKLAVRYFDWIRSDKKDTISQSKQFELYMSRCESAEEYEFLCSVIDKMEAGEQAKAAAKVTGTGTSNQRMIGIHSVARDLDHYDPSALSQIKPNTRHDLMSLPPELRVAAIDDLYASVIEFAEKNEDGRTEIAELYHNAAMDISRDKNYKTDIREHYAVQAQSVIQYAKTEQQAALIDDGYASEFKKAREEVANQSTTFDKTVQKYAVDKGLELDDEDIANILAKNAYHYDESVRNDIINTLENSGYDSVKTTLQHAKADYEAEQAAKSNDENNKETNVSAAESNSQSKSSSVSTSNASTKRIDSIINNKSTNTAQKAKELRTLAPKEQQEALAQLLQKATTPEIKGLALSGLKTEVINYLLDNYSVSQRPVLEDLKPMMSSNEKARFEQIIEYLGGDIHKNNFFIK